MKATASDFASIVTEINKNNKGVSRWEEFFLQPAQQTYQSAVENAKKTATADISQAYQNYKKSQINLMANQRLETGYKENINKSLENQYQSAYNTIQTNKNTALQNALAQYQNTLATDEENRKKWGAKAAEFENVLYKFGNIDTSLLDVDYNKGGLGFYKTENGVAHLTDLGRAWYDKMLNSDSEFANHLREEEPDLFEWYYQNLGDVREAVAGLDRNDMSYSKNDSVMYDDLVKFEDLKKSGIFKDNNAINANDYDYITDNIKTNYATLTNRHPSISDSLYDVRYLTDVEIDGVNYKATKVDNKALLNQLNIDNLKSKSVVKINGTLYYYVKTGKSDKSQNFYKLTEKK